MQILYKSDVTGKTYDSQKALLEAEAKVSEAKKQAELEKKERAEAAKIVQEKLTAASVAQKEAQKALSDFCKKYGTFKTSLKRDGDPWSFFDLLFNPFEF